MTDAEGAVERRVLDAKITHAGLSQPEWHAERNYALVRLDISVRNVLKKMSTHTTWPVGFTLSDASLFTTRRTRSRTYLAPS